MKKQLINFLTRVSFIFRPSFWISNRKTCSQWDKKLNILLDNPKFKIANTDQNAECWIILNDELLWIGNFPYDYGNDYKFDFIRENPLPRRATRIRLKNAIDNYFKNKV